jgi:hypothetical protein
LTYGNDNFGIYVGYKKKLTQFFVTPNFQGIRIFFFYIFQKFLKRKSIFFAKIEKNAYLAQEGVFFFILDPVYYNQAQTSYFEYIIPKKYITKVFRCNPTLQEIVARPSVGSKDHHT